MHVDVQCWAFDAAADGVELRTFTNHSMQCFICRCREADADFVCKKGNVAPILLIPGPKAPKHYAVFWWLVFQVVGADTISHGFTY